jgi:hypothetical protein
MENKDFWNFREIDTKEFKELLENIELEDREIIWNLIN